MMAASRRLRYSNLMLYGSLSSDCSAALPPFSTKLRSFASTDIGCGGGGRGARFFRTASENKPSVTGKNDSRVHEYEDDQRMLPNRDRRPPPEPIPNRPLRAEKPIYQSEQNLPSRGSHGPRRGGYERSTTGTSSELFRFDKLGDDSSDKEENTKKQQQYPRFSQPKPSGFAGENQGRDFLGKFGVDRGDKGENTRQGYPRYSQPKASAFEGEKQGHDFLDKFKLGFDKGEKQLPGAASAEKDEGGGEMKAAAAAAADEKLPPPPDADEIFKKLKETGLIPNAVAMLDGLCKDGLVQEAMKLFSLMREKGTIPEVVIYTAVVEGFCKAQKLDDAKRIFGKMKSNGISPNAFSYAVLIRGLCKGKRLEDAVEICVEMLDAGHSPNLATFTGLVDAFCREKGLEEAQSVIRALTQKGFYFDEKLVREYLDKKGPFLPLVWEAIFGKKSSEKLF
ncbi:hypothetical protein RHMOL_Rhmol12G0058300 [Rhododendron molle]|uniref:Uncharacterized protein n=1 Tax=Rhododendron molle TaxID=49168 RepID=A0ACC0LEP8_RHOML|nr:hypothetical protein RHMOL_Rhmol12G0058300 [Rhododendron molle]